MSTLATRIANLSPEQRRQLELRLKGRPVPVPPSITIPKTGDGAHRLSFAQERIWFIEQLEAPSAAYHLAWALHLRGKLDTRALQQALDAVVERQAALRTVFREVEGVPMQFIEPPKPVELQIRDLADGFGGAPRQAPIEPTTIEHTTIDAALRQQASRRFDLSRDLMIRAALLRLGQQEHILLLTLHHIAADGWSRGILLEELTAFYTAFATGKTPALADLPVSYADFAEWQRGGDRKSGDEAHGTAGTQLAYWKKQLTGAPVLLDLPCDHTRPPVQSYRGAREILTLEDGLLDQVKALCRQEDVTLFMTLLAAFQLLLHRYSGETDIVTGTPVANRANVETEHLIGLFVNTVALRTDFTGAPNFRALLQRVRETALSAYANQDAPFEQVISQLRLPRQSHHSPVFQTMFALLNAPRGAFAPAGLSAELVEVETGAAQFDLVLEFVERPEAAVLRLAYCTDLFEAATARRILGHFQTLLRSAVEHPNTPVSRLPCLTPGETQQILHGWNQTGKNWNPGGKYFRPRSAYRMFEAQAAATPNAVAAFQSDSEPSGQRPFTKWTYAELNQQADRVARRLKQLGAGPGTLVAVCLERSVEMVAGLLGIWKAGGAYLPLDPSHPKDRLRYILEDAAPVVVITEAAISQGHLRELFHGTGVQVAFLQDLLRETSPKTSMDNGSASTAKTPLETSKREASNEDTLQTEDGLAYVIYTSGSTGKPKGVAIGHPALSNLLQSMAGHLETHAGEVLLAITTISFDIAGLELFLPLVTGASIAIANRETASDGLRLARVLETSGATVMQATPATWQMLLDTGWRGKPGLKMVCGGEALPQALAEALLERGPLWNVYGPTETTIWSTIKKLEPNSRVVIGRPLDNTQLYILDREQQPVPVGVPGELYIGGDGLAQGYWRRPELTEEKFIPNPFVGAADYGKGACANHARLYRTGDMVRYLPTGDVEYVGRIDNQVKIRGFRIELGEIEAVLGTHTGVGLCAVIAREDSAGEKALIGYYESRTETQAPPSSATLRDHLTKDLPSYMLPAAFVHLARLPLTPNGKIDRKALAALKPSEIDLGAGEQTIAGEQTMDANHGNTGPRDPLEQAIARAWAKVLKVKQVGIHDDFFEVGGHSLAAVRLLYEIQKATGKTLPLATLFQASTVAALAGILRQDGWEPSWSPLVPIRIPANESAQPKPPLFLVHGAEGNVLLYRSLAEHLAADQPVYGLQSQGLDGKAPAYTTIEQMAARYVAELVEAYPAGLYYLGGYCLGGIIAFEMAQQLRAAGKKVELVLLLDTYASSPTSRAQALVHLAQNGWFHFANAASLGWAGCARFVSEKKNIAKERIHIRVRAAAHAVGGDAGAPSETFPHLQVKKINDQASDNYHPKPYAGRVALIRSKCGFSGLDVPDFGWSPFVPNGLEIHKLALYPKGMLIEPFCRQLADAISQCLATSVASTNHGAKNDSVDSKHVLTLQA